MEHNIQKPRDQNSHTENVNTDILPSLVLTDIPTIKIKSITFNNFKVFDNYKFDFSHDGKIQDFVCFIGSNGIGKSTTLNAIQLLFSNLEGMDGARIKQMLSRSIRHNDGYKEEMYHQSDFLVTAEIESDVGNYVVKMNREGFVSNHPAQIKDLVSRLCYLARFDMELQKFQISRDKWKTFKKLFEAVTGFVIEEQKGVGFSLSGTTMYKKEMKNYVFDFTVKKPNETISHKECSDGEKKIIKSFTTMLNLEYTPQIILIDNIEMHIEPLRHLNLIRCMKQCYPKSQIFTTTHSYHISRHFAERSQIYDLRIIHASPVVKQEPCRLYLIDIVQDAIMKLEGLKHWKHKKEYQNLGKSILEMCRNRVDNIMDIGQNVKKFVNDVDGIFIEELLKNK